MSPRISVVLSFRNEREVLPELVRRLRGALDPLPGGYELLFVDDASDDGSLDWLRAAAGEDPRVRVLSTSRRFGVSECVLLGFEHARGEALVYMDCDLQDPPELIPRLVDQWERGAEVVHTVREARLGEPRAKVWLTQLAYRLIRKVAEIDLQVEAGDFKLLSRRVAQQLLTLREARPYLRGLVAWVGFRQVAVPYERAPRAGGRSHFPLLGSLGPVLTLFTGLTSFSLLPLAAVLLAGLGVLALAVLGAVVLGALAILDRATAPGVWLALLVVACTGLQLTGLGVVALYVGRVYDDVRARPRALVASRIGFDE